MKIRRQKQQPIFSTLESNITCRKGEGEKPFCAPPTEEKRNSEPESALPPQDGVLDSPFGLSQVELLALGMAFVRIPPGVFLRGSIEDEWGRHIDEDQHEVTITRGFYLLATPVTRKQWKAVMGNDPSCFPDGVKDCPVDGVTWNDCQQFLERLNAGGARRYRLPTEAEWEYACRAGSSTAFANGDISPEPEDNDSCLDAMGWYCGNSGGKTHPVGQKNPNAWGLYDMHGSLCEWCQDWYGPYPSVPQKDPVCKIPGRGRVCRGGSWGSSAENCRSACRFSFSPTCRSDFVGARIVLDSE